MGCSAESRECCTRVARNHAKFREAGSVASPTMKHRMQQVLRFARLTYALRSGRVADPEVRKVVEREAADLRGEWARFSIIPSKVDWQGLHFTQDVPLEWKTALSFTAERMKSVVGEEAQKTRSVKERSNQELLDIIQSELQNVGINEPVSSMP